MNFNLTEEQEMLRKMARDFLTEKCPKSVVKQLEASDKGYSPELWKEMADLGWMGLVFPEKLGGSGMTFLDLAVLLEEIGRAALPGPFISSVVLGGMTIQEYGTDEQKQQYLPGLAGGSKVLTLALTEESGKFDAASVQLKAATGRDGYMLKGTKLFVPDAHIADAILCVARTRAGAGEDGLTVFIVDGKSPGIKTTVLPTIGKDKLCEVVFDGVKVPPANVLGKEGEGWAIAQKTIERAATALCCQTLGGLEAALDMTVAYAKERVQFDRPIGSFQIMQHYCADMLTDVEGCRFSTYQAAWHIAEGLPATKEVAVAKGWTAQVSERVITLAHQIHGTIGFTMDHDLHFYTMRSKAAAVTYGDADFYREVVAQQMGL